MKTGRATNLCMLSGRQREAAERRQYWFYAGLMPPVSLSAIGETKASYGVLLYAREVIIDGCDWPDVGTAGCKATVVHEDGTVWRALIAHTACRPGRAWQSWIQRGMAQRMRSFI